MFSSAQVWIVFLVIVVNIFSSFTTIFLLVFFLLVILTIFIFIMFIVQLPTDGGSSSAVSAVERHLRRGTDQCEGRTLEVIFTILFIVDLWFVLLVVLLGILFFEKQNSRLHLLRCESEECLVRNSGSVSPAIRQSPQAEDMGCQVGGGGGGQDQAEEEEQMLGSQLAELQQKLDRFVPRRVKIIADDADFRFFLQDGSRDDDSERGVSGARRHLGGARGRASSQGQNRFWN